GGQHDRQPGPELLQVAGTDLDPPVTQPSGPAESRSGSSPHLDGNARLLQRFGIELDRTEAKMLVVDFDDILAPQSADGVDGRVGPPPPVTELQAEIVELVS